MSSPLRTTTRAGVLALALAIAACSHGPRTGPAPASSPAPAAVPASEIDAILLLLDEGDTGAARKKIGAALKRDPMNPSLQVLRDSISRDPRELLGPKSFAYTTRNGETMSELAQRFLGNRLKAYQLARYNDIAKSADLRAGQTLRIPGDPPRTEVPRRPEPRTPSSAPTRTRPTTPKPTPAARTAAPASNPAAARQARASGLAALNAGNVGRAVGMLRRAAALDPGNPAIARDLARAQRIAATVRARK